jgi:hypothetical protein
MAIQSSIGQLTVGTSAVQLTANTNRPYNGIKVSVSTSGKVYYGPSTVTTANGFYISGVAEIHPAAFTSLSDIYFISDTASQKVSIEIVGQPGVTI